MSGTIDGRYMIGVLAIALALVVAASLLISSQPWNLAPLSWVDRWRASWFLYRYDWWLSMMGVAGRRRKELRSELRANLVDATAEQGFSAAHQALGSPRSLANTTAEPVLAHQPLRWERAVSLALIGAAVAMLAQFYAALAWTDGAIASGQQHVTGSITLAPGTQLAYTKLGTGFSVELTPGWWLPLGCGLMVGILTIAPWRRLAVNRRARPHTQVRQGHP